MSINKIYAQLNCTDLSASINWYREIFDRAPDSRPMDGLAEWHHHDYAGFQLFENAEAAGQGTLTLIVEGLRDEYARLEQAGLSPGDIESGRTTSIVQLHDLDNNLVVLAQPVKA